MLPIISQITNQELHKVNKCKPLYSKFHVTQQNSKFHIIVPSKQLIELHTLNEHEKKKKIISVTLVPRRTGSTLIDAFS